MRNPPKNFGAEVIGKDEEGFYVKRLKVNRIKTIKEKRLVFDYFLESYDNDMQLLTSVPEVKKKKEDRVIKEQIAHLMIKGKLFAFNTITDLSLKTYSLEMDEVDKGSMLSVDEPRTIAEV